MFKRKKQRKAAWVFIVLFAISIMSIGTGWASSTNKFVFWTWGDWTFYKKAFDLFVKDYPQYEGIEFENIQSSDSDEQIKKLIMAYATGTGIPDCIECPSGYIPELADAGVLLDLTKRIQPYLKDIPTPVLDSVSRHGKVWAVPWRPNTGMLFYRRDIFDMAGIDPGAIETWDDYIAAGKKVSRTLGGKERFMTNVGGTELQYYKVEMFLGLQDGLSIFDPNTGDTLIDKDPRAIEALSLLDKFIKEGIAVQMDDWSGSWWAALKEGRVASIVTANWMTEIMKKQAPETKGKWGIMLLPAFKKGGSRYAFQSGSANVAGTSETEMPDVVWEYMRHSFLDIETTVELNKTWWATPAYLPAQKDPFFHQTSEFYGGQYVRELEFEIQENAKMPHYTANNVEASSYIMAELMKAIEGQKTVEQAIRDAATTIRRKIGESF